MVDAESDAELDPVAATRDGANHVMLAPLELDELSAELTRLVTAWRAAHPGRQWADEAAQSPT